MIRRWLLISLFIVAALPVRASGQGEGLSGTNACILCHAGEAEEKISKPVVEWRESVHRAAGIACQECHGGAPTAMVKAEAHAPAAGYIGAPSPETIHNVCGRCHQLQRENYMASPHGIAGEFWPTCIDCHSNHRVTPPLVTAIAVPDKCADCHEDAILEQFITVVNRALVPIANARQRLETLKPSGVPVDLILARVDQAKSAFSQNASHTFTLSTITAEVNGLQTDFDRIDREILAAGEEVHTRRRFGIVLAALLVVLAGIVWMYRRTLP